jgi:hypothetical protein
VTVVAIDRVDSAPHYDGPLPHLIVVADSRISNSGTPSTETAPKIFPINVVAGTADGLLASFPYFGFAYAGSTLAANVTHATASHCLTNLFSSGPLLSPWTLDVARVYQAAARLQMHELGSRLTDPHGALFSGIVFGYSPLSAQVQAFKLTPRLHPSFEVDLEEILVSSTHYSFWRWRGLVRRHKGISGDRNSFARLLTRSLHHDSKRYRKKCRRVCSSCFSQQNGMPLPRPIGFHRGRKNVGSSLLGRRPSNYPRPNRLQTGSLCHGTSDPRWRNLRRRHIGEDNSLRGSCH